MDQLDKWINWMDGSTGWMDQLDGWIMDKWNGV